jgi:tetratricopeptide (TPR) repeat protein
MGRTNDYTQELIQKHLDGIATEAELDRLGRALVEDPEAAEALADAARAEVFMRRHLGDGVALVPVAALFTPPPVPTQAVPSTNGRGAAAAPRRAPRWSRLKWAAVALLLLAAGAVMLYRARREAAPHEVVSGQALVDGNRASWAPDGALVEAVGDGGATIRLADGSSVELGRSSKAVLHGPRAEARQVVELLQGEGRFRVTHGGGRFRVETPAGTVTALGTEFSVQLRSAPKGAGDGNLALAVTVTDGLVRVEYKGRQAVLWAGERRLFGDDDGDDPHLAPAWNNRGLAHSNLGQWDKAVADFSKAIELDPKLAGAWNGRGFAYFNLGQYDKAVADFSRAFEVDPHLAPAWNNRGLAHSNLGQYDKAVADLTRVIELAPTFARAHNALAWLLATCPDAKQRDPDRAVEAAKQAVQLAPQAGGFWNTLGVAHYRAGDWKAAVAALEKSMELQKGGDASDWLFLAMAHEKLGRRDEARKDYDRAVGWLEQNKVALAKNKTQAEELSRFRSEAEELLQLKK